MELFKVSFTDDREETDTKGKIIDEYFEAASSHSDAAAAASIKFYKKNSEFDSNTNQVFVRTMLW
jgi:hypothetical protein